MLERYFKKGTIFKWTRPPTTQVPLDGQIADKVVRTTPMTFIGTARDMGFGGMMDPAVTNLYLQQVGLQLNQRINYRWLDYMPGRTARVRIGRRNILTGPMSGCPIARWQAGATTYVGHVGTLLGMPIQNQLVKQAFQAVAPPNTTGFNPAGAWTPTELSQIMTAPGSPFSGPQILAFVTSRGHFYATAFFMVAGKYDRWYCAGSKLVAPLNGLALTALLG